MMFSAAYVIFQSIDEEYFYSDLRVLGEFAHAQRTAIIKSVWIIYAREIPFHLKDVYSHRFFSLACAPSSFIFARCGDRLSSLQLVNVVGLIKLQFNLIFISLKCTGFDPLVSNDHLQGFDEIFDDIVSSFCSNSSFGKDRLCHGSILLPLLVDAL